jgi:hypothetical protein
LSYREIQEYIDAKLKANEVLVPYKNVKFRKYKWYSFINKKTEDNLINIDKKTYSKNHKIIIGD